MTNETFKDINAELSSRGYVFDGEKWVNTNPPSTQEQLQELREWSKTKWLPNPFSNEFKTCSSCGRGTRMVYIKYDKDFHICSTHKYHYEYCPHCGAKIEGYYD